MLLQEEELNLAVSKVLKAVSNQNQNEIGWIYSATRNVVSYNAVPEHNEKIQKRVDHAVGGLAVLYFFSILENYISRKHWEYARCDLRKRMEAFLHIRNTIAHGFNGHRAERYTDQFNDVMKSDNPIRGVKSYDAEYIKLAPEIWQELPELFSKFLLSMLHQVVNYGYIKQA